MFFTCFWAQGKLSCCTTLNGIPWTPIMMCKIYLLRLFWVEQEEQACILQFIWSQAMGQPQTRYSEGLLYLADIL